MNLKIFHCRSCGTKVGWEATSCPVCNHLVSNDRAKRNITIGILTGFAIVLLVIALLASKL
jgi:hypothetical protein